MKLLVYLVKISVEKVFFPRTAGFKLRFIPHVKA